MSVEQQLEFEKIAEEHYTNLYRFALSLAKNPEDASDLTQHTFLVFGQKGQTIQDSSKAKSWLFTTLYREFLRTRRRSQKVIAYDNELLEAESEALDPDVHRKMETDTALDALNQLDEKYRAPLTLYFLKDFSYKEVAEVLDVPIGTVMSRLSRGKALLKQALTKR